MTSFMSLGKCKSEREKKNPKEILISNASYHFDFWWETLKKTGCATVLHVSSITCVWSSYRAQQLLFTND